ncbi:putative lipid II flippase FtsW [Alphaproteobacteria bacterium]|nr:putative lipid II flippase FtsW [Alphaproteobacteria bacterium]
MFNLGRTDRSVVGHWWWTVDKWILLSVFLLIGIGIILITAASPSVAERIEVDSFHFVQRQLLFLLPAIFVMVSVSFLSPLYIRRLGVVTFIGFFFLSLLTLIIGAETKGAYRWLSFGSFQIQPSEFIKPSLAIFIAWMLSEKSYDDKFPGHTISSIAVGLVLAILFLQPDIGMVIVIIAIWFVQIFISGISIFIISFLIFGLLFGAVISYLQFTHVANRIHRFIDPSSGDSYQVDNALSAFDSGGLLGAGPGEGVVKAIIPDAHADFIFAVAGEEFGLIAVLIIISLFSFIVLRGLIRLFKEKNIFIILASAGILTQLGLQSIINMGVNMRLLPAKGMTLPFISYGGSSLLALAFAVGIILALSRKRVESNIFNERKDNKNIIFGSLKTYE